MWLLLFLTLFAIFCASQLISEPAFNIIDRILLVEDEIVPLLEEHSSTTLFQLHVLNKIFKKLEDEAYKQIDFRIKVVSKEIEEYVLDKTAHAVDKCESISKDSLLQLQRQSKDMVTKVWLEKVGNFQNLVWESKVLCLEARIIILEFKEDFHHCGNEENTENLTFQSEANCLEDLSHDLERFEENVYKSINTAEKKSQEKINSTGQYIGVEIERIFHETVARTQNILDEFLTCDLQKIKITL